MSYKNPDRLKKKKLVPTANKKPNKTAQISEKLAKEQAAKEKEAKIKLANEKMEKEKIEKEKRKQEQER